MSAITALDLNNQIVKMRKVVGQAKFRLSSKIIRRIKSYKKKCESSKNAALLKRKIERYAEECPVIRRMKPDEVSKFALVNTKLLHELKIQPETPAYERVLRKLATSRLVVETVDEYREKHPNWHQEIPFLLQRLGLQYHRRKKAVEANTAGSKGEEGSEQNESGGEEDASLTAEKQPLTLDDSDAGSATLISSSPSNHLLQKDLRSCNREEKEGGENQAKDAEPQRNIEDKAIESKIPETNSVTEAKEGTSSAPSQLERLKMQRKKERMSVNRNKKKQRTGLHSGGVASVAQGSASVPPVVPVEGRTGEMEVRRLRLPPAGELSASVSALTGSSTPQKEAKTKRASTPVGSSEDENDPFFSTSVSTVRPETAYEMSTLREERVFDEQTSQERKRRQIQRGRPSNPNLTPLHQQANRSSHKTFGDRRREIPKKQAPVEIDPELHPSWRAKLMQKAQSNVKPAGTRIVFNEDDD